MEKEYKTLKEWLKSTLETYLTENGKYPDVFQCKVAYKDGKDGETGLIRIYDSGNSDIIPDEEDYIFLPQNIEEFMDLLADISIDRVDLLPDYDEVSEWLTEDEWGNNEHYFCVVDVIDMWNFEEN